MNSLWLSDNHNKKIFLNTSPNNIKSDVCIIGAGIFGLTCGYYLSNLGYKVIILEKDSIGSKTTGHTTAKITSQHGLFYTYLKNSFSENFAKDYLFANENAIKNIKNIIDTERIDCDFEYQNNYVYATNKNDLKNIKVEVNTVKNLGLECEFVTKTSLPFKIEGAICFKNQAQFHPLKYLYGLASSVTKSNGSIYTDTPAFDIKKDGNNYITYSTNQNIKSKYVIVATHYPFINFPGFYFTKMYQSTSYVIAVDTKESFSDGMYISKSEPIFSFRSAKYNGKKILLIGGGEHKTGQPSCYEDTYGLLEKEAKKYYPSCEVLFKWNTRDCISLDKLPYIGNYSSLLPNVYVGTGFKKWGMTTSNIAANIVVDMIRGKENKYAYLFDSSRLKPLKNIDEFKNVLIQSVNSLVLEKFKSGQMNFDKIKNNSGSIIEVEGEKIGIYKDRKGKIYAVKPICTHLGCQLSWNDIDKTWDCPCHGSRFNYCGKNIYDPAFKDLDIYNLDN